MQMNKDKIAYSLLLIFMFLFILIMLKSIITAQPGDENVYYYLGKLISDGKVPYRDFFYAHPPLHIYVIALIYKIFGFNIIALKAVPLISTLISAFFIFKISKRFGNSEAIISSLLFLFSYGTMFNSVFSFGINLATMFLVSGVYFLLNRNNPLLSGMLFGLAGITRFLSLIPIFVIFAFILLSTKKNFLKLLSGFLIIFLAANGLFFLFLGNTYAEQVYKYHLLKSFDSSGNFKEYIDIINLNWILFSSALLFIFIKDKKQTNTFAIASVVYLIFLIFSFFQ